jgi:hypothetical protein
MFSGDPGSLLVRVKAPEVNPLTVGVKIRVNWRLAPGLILTGTGKLPNEKALPCTDLEAIRRVLFPVLES